MDIGAHMTGIAALAFCSMRRSFPSCCRRNPFSSARENNCKKETQQVHGRHRLPSPESTHGERTLGFCHAAITNAHTHTTCWFIKLISIVLMPQNKERHTGEGNPKGGPLNSNACEPQSQWRSGRSAQLSSSFWPSTHLVAAQTTFQCQRPVR